MASWVTVALTAVLVAITAWYAWANQQALNVARAATKAANEANAAAREANEIARAEADSRQRERMAWLNVVDVQGRGNQVTVTLRHESGSPARNIRPLWLRLPDTTEFPPSTMVIPILTAGNTADCNFTASFQSIPRLWVDVEFDDDTGHRTESVERAQP